MDIKTLAVMLLIGKIIAEIFIFLVLYKQWGLRLKAIHPKLRHYRIVLSALALVIAIGVFIPMVVDILTLFHAVNRPVTTATAVYALANSITFAVASILIWTLYKLSSVVIEIDELVISASDVAISREKTDIALDEERVNTEQIVLQDKKK